MAKALGSGRPTEIVDVLAQGERSVDDIAGELTIAIGGPDDWSRATGRALERSVA